jgi:PAS domain S-box-containing protein
VTNNKDTPKEDGKRRSRADERLRKDKTGIPSVNAPEDSQRLLHELQLQATELERQNEELRQAWAESEAKLERYADLYDYAPVGYLLVDKGGRIVDANLEAAGLLGQHRDALLEKPLSPLIEAEDRPAFTAFLRLVHSTTTKHAREFRLLRGEEKIHVLVEAMNARSADDTEIGENEPECRLAIVDVTERKKAEESLRQTEAIYRALADNMDVGITLVDSTYTIIRTNPAQARVFGKEQHDFVGKKCFREFEHREQVCDHCPGAKARASRRPVEVESVGVRADGHHFVARIRACPWLGPNDEAMGFIELVEDITDRKRVEKQLDELAVVIAAKDKELQERTMAMEAATRAKDEFLANMSHELRTPLNVIISFSKGLLERIHRHPLNDHQQSRIRAITNSGEHLLMLVDGMLDLAKMESGRVQLNLTTFDMCAVADNIRDVAESLLKDRPDIRFTLELEKHLPVITSDRDKVRYILNNVLSNAVKFTKQGSITIRIRRQGTSFVIEARDTGIGMPQKYVDRVFEKFFQVPNASERALKGSGLGLAICKAYTELLGGTMSLQSAEGQGTTLTIALPLSPSNGYQPEVRDVEKLTRAKRASPPSNALLAKILCVEANAASMLMLTDSLTEVGYLVVPTSEGSEVIRLAIEEQPQLILLDLVLPEVDGWQILHRLKMDPATCRIPVVVVTSLDEERLALSLGADDYLRKPADQQKLLNSIRKLLSNANRGGFPIVISESSAAVDISTSGFPA